MTAKAQAFWIRVWILTIRMKKRCYDALNASRRRIYNIFYSKQRKVTQLQGESDRVFLQLLKKGLRQEIPLCDKVSKAECGFLESCIYTEK